jgi:tRNA (uracil-5-)-methyltransferase TRM9
MQLATIARLIDLNYQFYQTFAVQFSATRRRLQPGVKRILADIPDAAILLDIGCGNGELGRSLARRGFAGQYWGMDFSSGLLNEALKSPGLAKAHFTFLEANISSPGWEGILAGQKFDFILAFATLHHLPGEETRRQAIQAIHPLLAPGGSFIHSEWQFLNSPRLVQRIRPWETVGLASAEVDAGDYLLDWRQGGVGLRYVHHFSEEELARLASACGFRVIETFFADGEGGKLGLYQVWKKQLNEEEV